MLILRWWNFGETTSDSNGELDRAKDRKYDGDDRIKISGKSDEDWLRYGSIKFEGEDEL